MRINVFPFNLSPFFFLAIILPSACAGERGELHQTENYFFYLLIIAIFLLVFIFLSIRFITLERKSAKQNELLKAVNQASKVLLDPDMKNIEDSLIIAMSIMGKAVSVDRVCLWKNHAVNGKLYCKLINEWVSSQRPELNGFYSDDVCYSDTLTGWEETLKNAKCINMLVRNMSEKEKSQLKPQRIMSIYVAPVFVKDYFWGYVGYDDCQKERIFTDNEGMCLRSAGRMIANSFIRSDMTKNLLDTTVRLEEALKEVDEANKVKESSLIAMEKILNSIDAMIYVTNPKSGEILFINDSMKQHYNIHGDCTGKLCFKLLQKNLDKKCSFCPCIKLDIAPDSVIVWEEHSSLTNRIYKNIDRYIKWPNGKTVHMQQSVDITELVNAKDFAEESNRSKSAFLATMSHEIRTPMNAILGIAEIQLQDENLAPSTEDAFGKIYESGDLLLNIINDILDFSKIDAGKLEIIPVNYDIASLINDTAQLNRLRYESKPIEFIINVNENTPHDLIGDELRIKQILNNILSNAFKYTDSGKIEFSIFSEKTKDTPCDDIILIFKITDTGQGMTDAQIEKIFDEYTRFNVSANRSTIGAGLGMSITKRIIDLMDGSITIQSNINLGSVFTVRLPQKCSGTKTCGKKLSEKLSDLSFHNSSKAKKIQFLREYMPYGSVLVVDDVESNLYVAKGLLIPYGLKIDTSSSGFEAIDKIKAGNEYDVIFMDHMMPKMDGIEAVKIIRELGYLNPIVALTANALVGQSEIFLQNKFDGFISKPIDSRELNLLLNDLIRNKKPKEIVEAARQKQRDKEHTNTLLSQESVISPEIETFFIHDAQNAINVLDNLFTKINELDEQDVNLYITTVHGIKGALTNIKENELSALSYKLEMAGVRKDITVITTETPKLIDALKSLIEKFKSKKEDDENVKISDELYTFLKEKLKEIKTACGVFNVEDAKSALTEIKKRKWPSNIKIYLDEISMNLLHSAFKKISSSIDNFINELSL